MHQLTLFAPSESAKVLKFPTPATPQKSQETGLEAIYPQPNYGTCLKCESSIIWPGLDTCKCSGCGYVATKFVVFSAEYPKVKPTEVVPVEPAPVTAICEPMSDTEPLKELPTVPTATGKILTFTITTKRSAEMGVADPLLTGKKTCTRRLVTGWTASTVSWYQRAFDEGLNIQAWTAIPIAPESRKLADIRLTKAIYQEALKDMPDEDLEAEGGLWSTKDEFIETVCKGKPEPSLKVWVVRFEVVNICV